MSVNSDEVLGEVAREAALKERAEILVMIADFIDTWDACGYKGTVSVARDIQCRIESRL